MKQKFLLDLEIPTDASQIPCHGEPAKDEATPEKRNSHLVARGTSLSPSIVIGLIAVSDTVIVIASGLLAFETRDIWRSESLPLYLLTIVLNTILLLAIFRYAELYKFDAFTRYWQQLEKIVVSCATAFLLIAALAFAFKVSEEFSRVWTFSWLGMTVLLIVGSRFLYSGLLRRAARNGQLSRIVAVVGAGEQGRRLVERFQSRNDPWLRIIGIFDDRIDRIPDELAGIPVVGDLNQLVSQIRQHRIDEVYVALPWNAEARLGAIVELLSELPVEIYITSDLIGFAFPNARLNIVSGVQMLNVARKPFADWTLVIKQVEDWVLAGALVIFLAPLMLLVAAAIKLDSPGPVIFRQKRFGYNNQTIGVLKFRTMHHNRVTDDAVPQATRNDPRVTRIGRFLRQASVDELPQLFNVLNGTMSLVGPRPHAVAHNEQFAPIVERYFARHRVKPGLTGWAQVNGLRGETETIEKMAARVKHDLHYIENWSLLFDLRILVETIRVVLWQKNAY